MDKMAEIMEGVNLSVKVGKTKEGLIALQIALEDKAVSLYFQPKAIDGLVSFLDVVKEKLKTLKEVDHA